MIWTPIFMTSDNHLLCFLSLGLAADDEDTARMIGACAARSVQRLTGAEFTGEALHVGPGQRYVKATLKGLPVAILSGPAFTRANASKAA